MAGIWSVCMCVHTCARSYRTDSLTCGVCCYLRVGRVRMELDSWTPCWYLRTACWCEGNPPLSSAHLGTGSRNPFQLDFLEMYNLENTIFKDGYAIDSIIFLEITNNKRLKVWQKMVNLQYDIYAHIKYPLLDHFNSWSLCLILNESYILKKLL